MFDFSNQIVIVTGSSGNLGSAVARSFESAGATLVLVDRNEIRSINPLSNSHQDKVPFIKGNADLSDPKVSEFLVARTVERYGKIDVMVHTVGGYQAGKLPHETDIETWDGMHRLNARTTFLINRAVVPAMMANQGGAILNVASGAALAAGARDIAYSASKADVIRITESMSKAYKEFGIAVNAILPSTIDTPQNRAAMPKADYSKWVKPETIAQVILFLASESGKAITGALIPI